MRECIILYFFIALVLFLVPGVNGEDPYMFFNWKISYGDIYPLVVKQQVPVLFSKATIFEGFLLGLGVKESAFCFFCLTKNVNN